MPIWKQGPILLKPILLMQIRFHWLIITWSDLTNELNFAVGQNCRKVADEFTAKNPDKPRFVAGALGPTNKTTSLSPDVNDPGYRAVILMMW